MEALLFVVANVMIGLVLIWMVMNDVREGGGGTSGWFKFRRDPAENTSGPVNTKYQDAAKNTRRLPPGNRPSANPVRRDFTGSRSDRV